MTDRDRAGSGDEIPEEIREQFEHTPIYCRECELPVSVTVDRGTDQPQYYECSCRTVHITVAFPDRWVIP